MAIVDGPDEGLRANEALEALLAGAHGAGLRRMLDHMVRRARERAPRRAVERRLKADGARDAWVQIALAVLDAEDRVLVQVVDVTARREREERLQRLAEREPLTGLWNRRRFEQELTRQLARCQRHGECAVLAVIDVDGLKSVNDSHGHKAGDAVIRHVANALASRVRATDAVARIGGDEFAVLLEGTAGEDAATTVEQLCAAIAETPVAFGKRSISVTASAGFGQLDRETADEEAAFAVADAALYRQKARQPRPSTSVLQSR